LIVNIHSESAEVS